MNPLAKWIFSPYVDTVSFALVFLVIFTFEKAIIYFLKKNIIEMEPHHFPFWTYFRPGKKPYLGDITKWRKKRPLCVT